MWTGSRGLISSSVEKWNTNAYILVFHLHDVRVSIACQHVSFSVYVFFFQSECFDNTWSNCYTIDFYYFLDGAIYIWSFVAGLMPSLFIKSAQIYKMVTPLSFIIYRGLSKTTLLYVYIYIYIYREIDRCAE